MEDFTSMAAFFGSMWPRLLLGAALLAAWWVTAKRLMARQDAQWERDSLEQLGRGEALADAVASSGRRALVTIRVPARPSERLFVYGSALAGLVLMALVLARMLGS